MSEDEEERRRRLIIRQASESSALTVDEQQFLRGCDAAESSAQNTPLTKRERKRLAELVGKVAAG